MNRFSPENIYLWHLSSLNMSDFIPFKPYHMQQTKISQQCIYIVIQFIYLHLELNI